MGDLISKSLELAAAPAAGTEATGPAAGRASWVKAVSSGSSTGVTMGAPPPIGLFSLILNSFSSSSNSEREFFFIRSMIDLISFRSTVLLGLGPGPEGLADLHGDVPGDTNLVFPEL